MQIIAYQNLESQAELPEADAIVMDETAYQKIGNVPCRANLVVSENPNYESPGCHVIERLGGAVRFAISAGVEIMVVIGTSLYGTAIHVYDAEMR